MIAELDPGQRLDLALQQNSAILKSQADIEAAHGVVVQTRAIALPKVRVASDYQANEESAIDRFRPKGGSVTNSLFANAFDFADQRWSANARVVQSIYEGGRINSALRASHAPATPVMNAACMRRTGTSQMRLRAGCATGAVGFCFCKLAA